MFQHLERVRNQPEHVRKNVALGTAVALTAVVFIGWGAITLSSGSLALGPNTLTSEAAAPIAAAAEQTSSSFSNLLGAVGAAGQGDATPSLQIVDGGVSSTITAKSTAAPAVEQTVIPF